jgi:hypothetical protein
VASGINANDLYAHRYAAKPLSISYLSAGAQELAKQVLDVLDEFPGLDAKQVHSRIGGRYSLGAIQNILGILWDRFHVRRHGRQYWCHGDGRPTSLAAVQDWLETKGVGDKIKLPDRDHVGPRNINEGNRYEEEVEQDYHP